MKHDCPHCHGNMAQKFIRWTQIGHHNHARNCALCGGDIQWRFYPEEIATRVLTFVVLLVACYLAKDRHGGYLQIIVGAAAVIAVIYIAAGMRLANAQRFQKNTTLKPPPRPALP